MAKPCKLAMALMAFVTSVELIGNPDELGFAGTLFRISANTAMLAPYSFTTAVLCIHSDWPAPDSQYHLLKSCRCNIHKQLLNF